MTNKPSSPVCYASEVDDAYMGYAGRDELLGALNELLEAERAGARVALASARASTRQDHRELMQLIRKDEARWCAMLSRHIGRLDGTASRRTGSFYGKAVAIADPADRLAFLNRGQSWVVRKLEALIPRVRGDDLHTDLCEMLASHRTNIDRATDYLASRPSAD